jgi:hypothetical protein
MEPLVPAALPLVADHPDEARLATAPSEWEPGFLEGEGLHPEVYIYIYIYIYILHMYFSFSLSIHIYT